jgi:hypothetical protein
MTFGSAGRRRIHELFYTLPFEYRLGYLYRGIIALFRLRRVNVYQVRWFGHIESVLASLKFGDCCLLNLRKSYLLRVIAETSSFTESGGFIGSQIIFGGEGSLYSKLFPAGAFIIVSYMVWTRSISRAPR